MICSHSTFKFYNGPIVFNYITYFVYIPLNSYTYIHGILDFKYILLYMQEVTIWMRRTLESWPHNCLIGRRERLLLFSHAVPFSDVLLC